MTTSIEFVEHNKVYTDVTIICETEYGLQIGDPIPEMTYSEIADRCEELSNAGCEPMEIQVGESQESLFVKWWK